jgi:predicted amidophosphoribosyltransferase
MNAYCFNCSQSYSEETAEFATVISEITTARPEDCREAEGDWVCPDCGEPLHEYECKVCGESREELAVINDNLYCATHGAALRIDQLHNEWIETLASELAQLFVGYGRENAIEDILHSFKKYAKETK